MLGSNFLPPVVVELMVESGKMRSELAGIGAELRELGIQAEKTGAKLSAMDKGAVIGKTALKAVGLAAVAVAALSVKAAMDAEASFTRLGQAMTNAGANTAANRKEFSETIDKMEGLGFTTKTTAQALGTLITSTGNAEKAQKMMGIAADYARFKHIGLDAAAKQLSRGTQGAMRAFKELGITLDSHLPKNEAIAKAFDQLHTKIGGQAVAYTKTFKGQMEVLGAQTEGWAEKLGAVLLPQLTRFIGWIKDAASWLGKHKLILEAIAVVVGGILLTATVNQTRALWAQAVAWAAANWEIVLIIAAVVALAAGFIYAWNHFGWFRDAVIFGLLSMLKFWGFLLRTIGVVAEGFLQIVTGPLRLFLKALGFISPEAKKMSQELDKVPKAVGDFFDKAAAKVEGFSKTVAGLKDKKIDIKLGLPSLKIGDDFTKATGGAGIEGNVPGGNASKASSAAKDKLTKALQDANDAKNAMVKGASDVKDAWVALVGTDTAQAIKDGLADPLNLTQKRLKASEKDYSDAASGFEVLLKKAANAQNAYVVAVKSGSEQRILAAKSEADALQKQVDETTKVMSGALDKMAGYQTDLVNAIIDDYKKIDDFNKQISDNEIKRAADDIAAQAQFADQKLQIEAQHNQAVLDAQRQAEDKRRSIIQQSIDSLRNVFSQATGINVGEIFKSLMPSDKSISTTVFNQVKDGVTSSVSWWGAASSDSKTGIAGLLDQLRGKLTATKKLSDDAAALAGKGFSQTFIEQVVAQGTDVGDQMAQAILSSGDASITELQSLWTDIQAASNHGVDKLSTDLYAKMGLATEALQASYAQVGVDLQDTITKADSDMLTAVAKAQKDLDKTLSGIATDFDKNQQAIRDSISKTKTEIESLNKSLATITMPNFGVGVGVGTGVGTGAPATNMPTATDLSGLGGAKGASIIITNNNQTNASPEAISTATVNAIKYGMPIYAGSKWTAGL
jgi:hypothetical protein